MKESGKRYIGLDVHKHYLIALGVDEDLHVVLPARRVELSHLESWMKKTLTHQDSVVLEMTTNTWQLYDELCVYAGSVLVVHPPHVALITRSLVMNDKIAASILARRQRTGCMRFCNDIISFRRRGTHFMSRTRLGGWRSSWEGWKR